MDDSSPAPKKQRPTWFYVLLGCGGSALLMCLIGGVVLGFAGKAVKDVYDGVADREKVVANAKKALGTIPDGYIAVVGMKMPFTSYTETVLVKGTLTEDGGIDDVERMFRFVQASPSPEQLTAANALFNGESADARVLAPLGLSVRPETVIRRTTLTIAGVPLKAIVTRQGSFANDPRPALTTVMQVGCNRPDLMFLAVWSMVDPDEKKAISEIDLTGTVGDDAELTRFLKQMTFCAP